MASIRPAGNGRWRVAVMKKTGRNPETGRYEMVVRVVRGTKEDAKRVAREIATAVDQGTLAEGGRVPLATYLTDRWLPHAATRVRGRTHHRYAEIVSRHVVPHIGQVRLGQIRPHHVQLVVDRALARGLSGQTVVHVYRVLSASLKQAVDWQLVPVNHAKAVHPPRPERPKLTVPTADEVSRLLDAAKVLDAARDKDDGVDAIKFHPVFLLAATTGMRRGELLGLRWTAVDLDAGRLEVVSTLMKVKTGEVVASEPKTPRSRRPIRLGAETVAVLRAHRKAQAERRLLVGAAWQDNGLVFDRGDGGSLDPDLLSLAWGHVTEAAGVPGVRLHDLRHAHASALLRAGESVKVVSSRLGHASSGFTLDTYAHVIPADDQGAADAIERALGLS